MRATGGPNPVWRFLAVSLLLGAFVYGPSLRGGFLWDDDDYVTRNPTLTSAGGLSDIWFHWGATPQYYPLVFTSFWVEQRVFGPSAAGHRATNLLLHVLNALLVFLILRRLHPPAAWGAALLFLVHPVHVESVAWITERKNLLSGLFYLSSFLLFWRGAVDEAGPDGPRRRLVWGAVALFVAALLSKTVACSLPVVLFLAIVWKKGFPGRAALAALVAMVIVGVPLALLTVNVERHVVGTRMLDWPFDWVDRAFLAGRALWFYPLKIAWPSPLMFFYPAWDDHTRSLVSGAVLVAFAAAPVVFFRSKMGRGAMLCVLAYAAIIFPALGFIPVYPLRFSYVADHFQYLASIPVLALAVGAGRWALTRLNAGPRAAALALAALVAGSSVLALDRTAAFLSREALWTDTVRKNPTSVTAQNNLGVVLLEKEDYADALRAFGAAAALRPDHQSLTGAGIAALRLGRPREAGEFLRRSLAIEPGFAQTHIALAEAELALDEPDNAFRHAELAARLLPGSDDARRLRDEAIRRRSHGR